MRNANGTGSVTLLKGNRRNKWIVRAPAIMNSKTDKWERIIVGYAKSQRDAYVLLDEYLKNPNIYNSKKITFEKLYGMWSGEYFRKVGTQSVSCYHAAYLKCETIYNMPIIDIKRLELQDIINSNMHMSSATRKSLKNLFSQLFKFAIQNDYLEKNYSSFLDIGVNETKIKRTLFSCDEIGELWGLMPGNDIAKLLLIYLYTGLRKTELFTIKKSDIFLEKQYMIGGSKTKAGKDRIIPLHHQIIPLIEYFMKEHTETLFCDGLMTAGHFYTRKSEVTTHYVHDTRYTFISRLSELGVDQLLVKRIVGHSSGNNITDHYTIKELPELIKAVNKLNY